MKINTIKAQYLLNKFAARLSKNGNKKQCLSILLKFFINLQLKKNERIHAPINCFVFLLLSLGRPKICLQEVRKGSNFYNIPVKIKPYRSHTLLFIHLNNLIKESSKMFLGLRLKTVFVYLIKNSSLLLKETNEIRKAAIINRRYRHYRWKK